MQFININKPIQICDIGANPIDETGFIDNLFKYTKCQLVGFEPDEEYFQKLKPDPNKKFYNYAIGDGNIKDLNICAAPGMSSILKPNIQYLKMFHEFEKWAKIIRIIPVKTKKLDDINFDEKMDLIKIDVQGYESEVIKYGNSTIKDALVVQIETSPIPLYHGEKTFSFVSNQLENLGFNLHMFNRINTRSFIPMTFKDLYSGLNHLFQLDCVFIKNFDEINKYNEEQLKKLILILFYSFQSYDLVLFLILKLEAITKKNYSTEYKKLLEFVKMKRIY